MRIGMVSSAYVGWDNYREGFEKIKSLGYDAIDYGTLGAVDSDRWKAMSASEMEKYFLDVRKTADEVGIDLWQSHGPWRYPPTDNTEELRTVRFGEMSRSVEIAGLMKIPYWIIHPIMPYGCWQNPEPERFMELNLEYFTRLTEVAKRNNVIICFENMPFPALSLARPSEILNFVKTINSPNMKVCLDTGHCSVCGESPADGVRLTGKEYLATLHVHDNNGKQDLHWIPYTGVIDWPDFSRSLNEIGFDGVLSLETNVHGTYLPEDIRDDMQLALVKMAKRLTEMPQ